jgi:tRNA A37 threonylcarbamoyladenosine dehydratase
VDKVRKSFIIVVGVGGVGSHAAHMLIRSGCQRIRIIDFDQVSLVSHLFYCNSRFTSHLKSSLNRHAVATFADVGTPKVSCLAKHFKEIAPQAIVEVKMELFNLQSAPLLLSVCALPLFSTANHSPLL